MTVFTISMLFDTVEHFYSSSFFSLFKQQGAATTVFAATCKELEDVGGMYFNNCWVCEPSPLVQSREFCEKVYQLGEQILVQKMGEDAFECSPRPPVEFKTMSGISL